MPFAVIHHGHIELGFTALGNITAAGFITARAAATRPNRGFRHGERAVHGGDVVVARLCALVERIGEGVFTCAYRHLRSCVFVVRTFAIHKTIAAHSNFVFHKSRAVIDLARITARERDRALGDRDSRGIGLRDVARRGDLAPHRH